MKLSYLILGGILIIALAVMPAQAFTANTLTVTLNGNGDAQAVMQYSLSPWEEAAIYFHVADPASTLQNALSENLGRQVTVVSADMSLADVIIPSFASVTQSGGTTTMTTPGFSFANAQQEVENEWYGALISADFAPQTTTIIFPDGYQATYYNQISIPSVSHTIQ